MLTVAAKATSNVVIAINRSVLCRPIAFISRNPSPRCEANISPSSVPISVREKPMRSPVKISGKAAGIRIERIMSNLSSLKTRPVLISTGRTLRTAMCSEGGLVLA